jgi:hypothetical protein
MLYNYNIIEGSTLHLVLRLRGGCFASDSLLLVSKDGSCIRIDEASQGMKIMSFGPEMDL